MSAAVLLITMRCNIRCAHCSVDSHPERNERMPLASAIEYLRQLAALKEFDTVDVSGGEPMIYLSDIKALAHEARRLGLSMRITSNGFWANSAVRARRVLQELQDAGIRAVGLSIDEWHLPFVPPAAVANYVEACRQVRFQPFVSAVVRGAPTAAIRNEMPTTLIDLLHAYRLDIGQVVDFSLWDQQRRSLSASQREHFDRESVDSRILLTWQILTGEGRGRDLDTVEEPFGSGPLEPCSIAGQLPTIDPSGKLFPCCSPWTSRKNHSFATVTAGSLASDLETMRSSALVRLIHNFGPERLITALARTGVQFEATHSGICNQCGQLFDRFSLEALEAAASYLLDEDRNVLPYRVLGISNRYSLKQVLEKTTSSPG